MDCFASLAMTFYFGFSKIAYEHATLSVVIARQRVGRMAALRSTTTKCTRGRGCNGHPAFPTPSLGGRFFNASGAWRGEVVNVCLDLPSLRAKRSNPSRRAKEEWIASSLR